AVAIIPGAVVTSLWIYADARQRFAEPERAQDPGGVGTKLDTSANLTERFGLLEELGVDAARSQRQERGEPPDAAARDKHFEIIGPDHSCSSQPGFPDEHRIWHSVATCPAFFWACSP